MRRFFLCFLLCLMPLRLWAGAWMPMPESGSSHLAVLSAAGPAQHNEVPVVHDCHEAMSDPCPNTALSLPCTMRLFKLPIVTMAIVSCAACVTKA